MEGKGLGHKFLNLKGSPDISGLESIQRSLNYNPVKIKFQILPKKIWNIRHY